MAAYLGDVAAHPGPMLSWFDLKVYNNAGLIAGSSPGRVYSWQLKPGIKFTYPPFAALLFAAGSLLPWAVLRWLMSVTSIIAVTATAWLTLGGLGRRGRDRTVATLAVAAVAMGPEPGLRALQLGRVGRPLVAILPWYPGHADTRREQGAGVG